MLTAMWRNLGKDVGVAFQLDTLLTMLFTTRRLCDKCGITRNNYGAILRQLWGNSAAILRQFCGNYGAILRQLWGKFAASLRQFCGNFAAILRQFCGNSAAILLLYGKHYLIKP